MRLVIASALACASLLVLAPAAAQPVRTAQLAPNEVLLEINGLGITRSRADIVRLSVAVSGRGETGEQARAAATALADRVTAAARGAGVAEADVRVTLGVSGMDPDMIQAMQAAGQPVPQSLAASGIVQITLRDPSRIEQLRAAVRGAGIADLPEPEYRLSDDREARRLARQDALRTARADADAYAAAMGMRVVRIVRVTERLGMDLFGSMVSAPEILMEWRNQNRGREIETRIFVGVDFALAPQ